MRFITGTTEKQMPAPRAHSGYTLLELMIVILVIGVLAGVAVPSFNGAINRNARDSYALELQTALNTARAEAVTSGNRVSICRSTDQATCAGVEGADWNDGWIIFIDGNGNGVVEATDTTIDFDNDGVVTAADPILEAKAAKNGLMAVTLVDADIGETEATVTDEVITFTSEGFLDNLDSSVYFKLCSRDNEQEFTQAVVLTSIGRASLSNDGALVCP